MRTSLPAASSVIGALTILGCTTESCPFDDEYWERQYRVGLDCSGDQFESRICVEDIEVLTTGFIVAETTTRQSGSVRRVSGDARVLGGTFSTECGGSPFGIIQVRVRPGTEEILCGFGFDGSRTAMQSMKAVPSSAECGLSQCQASLFVVSDGGD